MNLTVGAPSSDLSSLLSTEEVSAVFTPYHITYSWATSLIVPGTLLTCPMRHNLRDEESRSPTVAVVVTVSRVVLVIHIAGSGGTTDVATFAGALLGLSAVRIEIAVVVVVVVLVLVIYSRQCWWAVRVR
jgi:hypothetical protein